MKISQKQIILNLLQETNDWIPSWKFLMVDTKWGWLGSQAKRRVQELAAEGKVESRLIGKYVHYRANKIIPLVPVIQVLKPEARIQALKFN